MTSSAIPAVKAALKGVFDTEAANPTSALNGVAIARGQIDPRQEEMVQIFDADGPREWRSLGNQPAPMDEEVEVEVVVEVLRASGTDWEPAEDRLWEIVEACEDAFRADIKLGGAWRFGKITKVRQRYFREDRQRGSRAFLTFQGEARI